ncbi:type IX secretion system membrane protein PorP/SprF [Mariniflexile sp. AS56]|uniref:PorP/SprF family type IX secretion system membrane protein n=1 Tax=Mariniflexile sp. AS56 TaxID=3063957 RepID=UPI0026EC8476|nr:type IX secretion system membrane protein PorP/SprF [Mariniflexile sp. AS56]MDO7171447.1 type IX secretion system membrane protein PorP/SprF [Mariniflexile sp. AS56]
MRSQITRYSILLLVLLGSAHVFSQQEPQYAQYMYNTQSINPAYAGTENQLSLLGLHRSQWAGLEGAPKTQIISMHAPFGDHVGLGLNITNDKIFIAQSTYIAANFSYKVPVSERSILSFGLQAGGKLMSIDSNRLNNGAESSGDQDASISDRNNFTPQMGFGAYYYTNNFFLGFSIPGILDSKKFLKDEDNKSTYVSEKPHYYLLAGYSIELNKNVDFKPSTLLKVVDGAPLQLDLSANFLFYDDITLGVAYRWDATLSAMAAFQVTDKLLLGFAYEIETSKLQKYNGNSTELILRYNFIKNPNKTALPLGDENMTGGI